MFDIEVVNDDSEPDIYWPIPVKPKRLVYEGGVSSKLINSNESFADGTSAEKIGEEK